MERQGRRPWSVGAWERCLPNPKAKWPFAEGFPIKFYLFLCYFLIKFSTFLWKWGRSGSDSAYVATGGVAQKQGRSAIDNTVLRNVFFPWEADFKRSFQLFPSQSLSSWVELSLGFYMFLPSLSSMKSNLSGSQARDLLVGRLLRKFLSRLLALRQRRSVESSQKGRHFELRKLRRRST